MDVAREPDLMTLQELTERLGLSKTKTDDMQRLNELPFPTIKLGGRVLFSRRAYNDWLSQYDFRGDSEDMAEGEHK